MEATTFFCLRSLVRRSETTERRTLTWPMRVNSPPPPSMTKPLTHGRISSVKHRQTGGVAGWAWDSPGRKVRGCRDCREGCIGNNGVVLANSELADNNRTASCIILPMSFRPASPGWNMHIYSAQPAIQCRFALVHRSRASRG